MNAQIEDLLNELEIPLDESDDPLAELQQSADKLDET